MDNKHTAWVKGMRNLSSPDINIPHTDVCVFILLLVSSYILFMLLIVLSGKLSCKILTFQKTL